VTLQHEVSHLVDVDEIPSIVVEIEKNKGKKQALYPNFY